jgi:hypothetical protein
MIADLFPENKYPSEEVFCEMARQVLTQRQPERIRLMVQSGQWDAFFRSAISSTVRFSVIQIYEDHPNWFFIQK